MRVLGKTKTHSRRSEQFFFLTPHLSANAAGSSTFSAQATPREEVAGLYRDQSPAFYGNKTAAQRPKAALDKVFVDY